MRRKLITSAVGTTAVLIGLGVGAALATADPVQSSPIATHTLMADLTDMTGMMQLMMGSSMTDEQVPIGEIDHTAHHQEVRP